MTPADEIRAILVTARMLGMPATHRGFQVVQQWLDEVEAGRPGRLAHGDIVGTVGRARSWLGSVRAVHEDEGPAGLQR